MKHLLAIILMFFCLQGMCDDLQFISELKVFSATTATSALKQLKDEGYEVLKTTSGSNADLNDGGNGRYIYLGYKKTYYVAQAIKKLLVVSGGEYRGTRKKTITLDGFTYQAVAYNEDSDGGNLNRGRGTEAADLFLYYSTDFVGDHMALKYITTLEVASFSTEITNTNLYIPSYSTGKPANLNEGGGAKKFLYLTATYHTCGPHVIYTNLKDGTHRIDCTVCRAWFGTYEHSPARKVTTRLNDKQCYNQCICDAPIVYNHEPPTYGYWHHNNDATHHHGVCKLGCGQEYTAEHVFDDWGKTETEHVKKCKDCGYEKFAPHVFVYEKYSAELHKVRCETCGHSEFGTCDYVVDEPAVTPTCTEAGQMVVRHCRLCNQGLGEKTVLPATGHNIVHVKSKKPTCTNPAEESHYRCTVCGQLFLDAEGLHAVSQEDLQLVYGPHIFGADGFCSFCKEPSAPPVNTEDNYYEISNIGHLYWYAQHGWMDHDARLMQDITDNVGVMNAHGGLSSNCASFRQWSPIGYSDFFNHVFDGQGHTISGIYTPNTLVPQDSEGQGLFARSYGVIKNLTLADSYIDGYNACVGSICGVNWGTVMNCISSAHIRSWTYGGGICSHNRGDIRNCAFTGYVYGYENAAGLVCNNGASLENCYSTGDVESNLYADTYGVLGLPPAELVCYNFRGNGTATHCYAIRGESLQDLMGSFSHPADCEDVRVLTPEQFASGEACWLLNNGSEAPYVSWRQTLGRDELPSLFGPVVYYDLAKDIYTNDKPKATVGTLVRTIHKALEGQKTKHDIEEVIDAILER